MTIRDNKTIHTLYYFHRYTPASISRLFGLSHQRILQILHSKKGIDTTVSSQFECQICGADECQSFYIDGNKENKNPQNVIELCEPDLRKFRHLQIRKHEGLLIEQLG
jgi:hypothetical protein